jgi:hypothetical protein
MIEARVASLNNDQLSQRFSELTQQLFIVREELADKKIGRARKETKKTFELAGSILALLYELEKLERT